MKFCGHCQPHADMTKIYEQLGRLAPDICFTYYHEDSQSDVLLVMHACPAECATVPPFAGRILQVSPWMIEHWPAQKETFALEIIKWLKS